MKKRIFAIIMSLALFLAFSIANVTDLEEVNAEETSKGRTVYWSGDGCDLTLEPNADSERAEPQVQDGDTIILTDKSKAEGSYFALQIPDDVTVSITSIGDEPVNNYSVQDYNSNWPLYIKLLGNNSVVNYDAKANNRNGVRFYSNVNGTGQVNILEGTYTKGLYSTVNVSMSGGEIEGFVTLIGGNSQITGGSVKVISVSQYQNPSAMPMQLIKIYAGGKLTISEGSLSFSDQSFAKCLIDSDSGNNSELLIKGGIFQNGGFSEGGAGVILGEAIVNETSIEGGTFISIGEPLGPSLIGDAVDMLTISGDGEMITNAVVTGNYSMPKNLEFPSNIVLTVRNGATFTIPKGKTVENSLSYTNNGTFINEGTFIIQEQFINEGTLINAGSKFSVIGEFINNGTFENNADLTNEDISGQISGEGSFSGTLPLLAPTITTPNGTNLEVTVGEAFTYQLEGVGYPAVSWKFEETKSGFLQKQQFLSNARATTDLGGGLLFDATTGILSGTPTNEGEVTYTITATNGLGETSSTFILETKAAVAIDDPTDDPDNPTDDPADNTDDPADNTDDPTDNTDDPTNDNSNPKDGEDEPLIAVSPETVLVAEAKHTTVITKETMDNISPPPIDKPQAGDVEKLVEVNLHETFYVETFGSSASGIIGINKLTFKLWFNFVGKHLYVGEYLVTAILLILTGISVTYDIITLLWFKKKHEKRKRVQRGDPV
jgi:hypothetical protein